MTFRVVGIGASAGGLEAVSELLGALPAGTGVACIVVQHLDPHHGSLLTEILAKTAKIPVTLASDGEIVQPDHAYVIPPNATLTVKEKRFQLVKRPANEPHHPIDSLFESIAVAYGDAAVGVVLSGGDADGSQGLQAIKREGGIVFAQSPDSARFPDMPRNAIDTGGVDDVMAPAEIANELARLSRQSTSRHDGSTADGDEGLLKRIFQRIRSAHGLDFSHYKRSTLHRRLDRRMSLRGTKSLAEYSDLLERDPAELAALHHAFLIPVTEFFRDAESFAMLRQQIFPALRERRDAGQPIRIWVPGCATGEEVYSLAIELLESIGAHIAPSEAQIFGTDVSEVALDKARAGIYRAEALRGVSSERLHRFFEKHGDDFRIVKAIRDLCIFARQDVTHDPPFSRLDLVSCRNLLIYLDEVAQRRVMQAFHFALRPNGTLVIGPAESIGQASEFFEQVDKRFRAYRRRPGSGPGRIGQYRPIPRSDAKESLDDAPAGGVDIESLSRESDRWLLARFAPASLVVDEGLNIRQFRGRTGPFLEPAAGPPSLELQRVIRPELLIELMPAIRQARESGVMVRRDGIRLDDDREVSIEVVPLSSQGERQGLLILFDNETHPATSGRAKAAPAPLPETEKDRRLARLQHEVEALRDHFRVASEEHTGIQEELRSAHEEMLSANEEYQSTNEELETSKEELQSTNEELTTTVEELRIRNRDLGILNTEVERARAASERAQAYADAIIETVRSPLAVIDDDMKVRRVNRAFMADLEIPRERVERLFVDAEGGDPWNAPTLRSRLHAVVHGGQPLEDWEVTLHLPHRGPRVATVTARRIPGDGEREKLVLLVIDDVTDRASVAADLLANSKRKDEFLALLAHELRHPLTPIAHAIHLLGLADSDPATAELYKTIDEQTQRLVRFVNDILDVVRLNRGVLEIIRTRFELGSLVREAGNSMRPMAEQHGLSLTVAITEQPMFVDGDSGRLSQVVTNLLENAIKYTHPGGQISLTLEQHGVEAVLSVRDTGVGIPPALLTEIFEPFTQAHTELARTEGGLGLGLSVVRHLVSLHGGRVEARSRGVDAGSEFVVWLPTAPGGAGRAPEPVIPPRKSTSKEGTQRKKVLVVDDREEVTRSLTRLITVFGHIVAVARDGTSALALAANFQPDCAIVDLGLPGITGYDLAPQLRQLFPSRELNLIAYTGHEDLGVLEKCRAAGFNACVIKPGDASELETLLREPPIPRYVT